MNKSIVNLLIVSLVGLFLVLGCNIRPLTAEEIAEQRREFEEYLAKPKFRVSSRVLADHYEESDIHSTAEYMGKRGEVYGTFDHLTKVEVIHDERRYTTYRIQFYENVSCTMREENQNDVLNFREGDDITLIGTVTYMVRNSAGMRDCIVKK